MFEFFRNRVVQNNFELDEEERKKREAMHAQANVYKDLCNQANEMIKQPNNVDAGNGWVKVDSSPLNTKSNFKGVVYQKGDQYAIAFVGTDKFSLKDHGANLKMGLTGDSRQIQDAKKFAEDMKEKYGLTAENTVSIGHSEGGTEATHVGIDNGFKTFTYNAFGVHKSKLPEGANYSLITNYRDAHDPVSKMHKNIGTTYITPSTQNWVMRTTPFGSIQSHSLSKMGDCTASQPLETYKRKNKMFLDHITDAEITREDIGEMEPKMFSLFEPEINRRMEKGQIYSSSQLAHSGAVYVPGYTRSDGVQVRGYYRRMS